MMQLSVVSFLMRSQVKWRCVLNHLVLPWKSCTYCKPWIYCWLIQVKRMMCAHTVFVSNHPLYMSIPIKQDYKYKYDVSLVLLDLNVNGTIAATLNLWWIILKVVVFVICVCCAWWIWVWENHSWSFALQFRRKLTTTCIIWILHKSGEIFCWVLDIWVVVVVDLNI